MDGAMAQDKNRLDDEAGEVKPEPTLSLPSASNTPGTPDTGSSEPPFKNNAPMQLLPPPIPSASAGAAASASAKPPSSGGFIPSTSFVPATDFVPSPSPAPEAPPAPPELPAEEKSLLDTPTPDETDEPAAPRRRMARRRAAGPSRNRIAANDDGPSIGGLIFALQQKPSNTPFKFAGIASIIWATLGVGFAIASFGSDAPVLGWLDLVTRPTTFLTIAAIVVPIGLLWLMALLAWRTEELRLRSSTMTEVAIRLAEPDRLAEQNVASLGQAVRRQVGFMNDAITRALGRAGELEAMVHNEVAVLERSYEDNERKIRGLISELSGERHALVNTSDRVSESLMRLGSEIPTLIEKLSDQQVKLGKVIEGAGENLTMLETSLASSVGNLETAVGGRTEQLQNVLESYTTGLAGALESRAEQLQVTFDSQLQQLDTSLVNRTENLQTVFEEYARALDAALANRAQALDYQLVERTRSLDEAFGERLRLFDESIMRSTSAIDSAVVDKTEALTNALDAHAVSFRETIGKQATDLDEALMHGINSVRRASENITRQSIKAMEGLASQSDLLKNISENLLNQISGVTGRFENQGQQIMKAANALETANFKIDKTLQNRHAELSTTLDRLSGKADEFTSFVGDYSTSIAGSLSDADMRARSELERMRATAAAESERTLEDLRSRLTTVSTAVTSELGSLTDRFTSTSEEMRQQASRTSAEIAAEQMRLRNEMERLPLAAQESSEGMRRALHDQIKALDQLSQLAARSAVQRDVTQPPAALHAETVPPTQPPAQQQRPQASPRSLTSLSSTIAQELGNRQRQRGAPADSREGWSLGDLLARASRDEDGHGHGAAPAGAPRHAQAAFNLDLEAIARALDPATAAAIWSRIRSGQRGVMVRSIYGNEGRAVFDDVSHRCRNDGELSRTVSRYLTDFERIIAESDGRDPSGRLSHGQLISDTGRVYLFLAHAAGRLG
jgi:predicted pyridoxine 5'-phosphate oxidase superfamily flavin-nucleotide-binding protein